MANIPNWDGSQPQGTPDLSGNMPNGGVLPTPFGGLPPQTTPPATPPTATTPVGNQELAAYINYLKSLGLDTVQINSIISDPSKTITYNGTKYTAQQFWDMWAAETYGDEPPASPYTPQVSLGGGDEPLIPKGFSYHPAGFLIGPDGEYYDYGVWIDSGYQSFIPVGKEAAELAIGAWTTAQNKGGSGGTQFLGGIPTRETDSSGQEWWVYKDPDGNITRVEPVDDSKARENEQKFTSPREWIQRWGVFNPNTLPQTPAWLSEHTGLPQGAPIGNTADAKALAAAGRYPAEINSRPLNPLGTGSPILASGQSLSRLAPSELEGTLGYMDWAAGRGSPYASGEDWQYRSAQLLPTNQPKRTVAWNPNQRA